MSAHYRVKVEIGIKRPYHHPEWVRVRKDEHFIFSPNAQKAKDFVRNNKIKLRKGEDIKSLTASPVPDDQVMEAIGAPRLFGDEDIIL